MPNLIKLQDALNSIKSSVERAIKSSGTSGKNNLIRSQKPIKLLHDVVKSELIRNGVKNGLINPALGKSNGELSLSGFFKKKDQDICVTSKLIKPKIETLSFEGILMGQPDRFGHSFTEHTLSINVRSQLSSSAKNFDTLYERTFAEALNLHLRCPQMVLGEFYMIAVNEYDSDSANRNKVKFRNIRSIENHIEKYILSFNAINNRKSTRIDHYKYERVCLLIVDFSKPKPKVYSNDNSLIEDGLLPEKSKASMKKLNFDFFIKDLLEIYKERFGFGNFN
jgi:hypothetical protein